MGGLVCKNKAGVWLKLISCMGHLPVLIFPLCSHSLQIGQLKKRKEKFYQEPRMYQSLCVFVCSSICGAKDGERIRNEGRECCSKLALLSKGWIQDRESPGSSLGVPPAQVGAGTGGLLCTAWKTNTQEPPTPSGGCKAISIRGKRGLQVRGKGNCPVSEAAAPLGVGTEGLRGQEPLLWGNNQRLSL